MPTNETFIMLGLGAAALWFLNRGGSEEDQVDQLAGAAMMASGEGTAPDAPFQAYGAPSNPSFFFNEGGQMAKVSPKSNGAADKPPYTEPELQFQQEQRTFPRLPHSLPELELLTLHRLRSGTIKQLSLTLTSCLYWRSRTQKAAG